MSNNLRVRQIGLMSLLIFTFCGWGELTLMAQQADDEDETRQVFASEFLMARPQVGQRRTPPAAGSATNKGAANRSSSMIGVTLWRLRPAAANDDTQARLLEHEADSEVVLVGERVSSDTKFQEGQKVRLSIESPRTGYLYVVDREQYADGTYSEPYLIFPTLKMRDGDNSVTAGRLIEIPDQEDRPFYFKMNRHRPDQTGEVLTFIVSTQPLPNLQLGRKALKLTNEQFAQWEQKWKAPAKRVEFANRAGKPYTKVEMTAGSNLNALLGPNDPLPQTIYVVSAKPGEALMLTVPLQYNTSVAPKN